MKFSLLKIRKSTTVTKRTQFSHEKRTSNKMVFHNKLRRMHLVCDFSNNVESKTN